MYHKQKFYFCSKKVKKSKKSKKNNKSKKSFVCISEIDKSYFCSEKVGSTALECKCTINFCSKQVRN